MPRPELRSSFALCLGFCALLAVVSGSLVSPAWAINAEQNESDPYRKVRVAWDLVKTNREAFQGLEAMGIEVGAWMEYLARDAELQELNEAGIPFDVVVPDLVAEFESRPQSRAGGGNFGIFHTYSETVAELDAIHANFPSITTDKISLGTTWEGRTIWAMKISDNPNVEEPNEPEVLFDGVHHAREIMTVEVCLDFMNWLTSNYGIDDEATELVNTRQIWFVPVVNPDGFVWNETTNPAGGGLWRKNRRNDLGACVGVDLNRNYLFQWGGAGASTNPCDETYRGPSAGSELEAQAMMNFINSHSFVTHNSYHSVVGAILFPWGYQSAPLTPDDSLFRSLATEMARDSSYPHGTAWDILSYLASGGFFDWTYGETGTKPRMISFTTEIGGTGFWPAESERPGLLAENLYSNIFLARVAGVSLGVESFALAGGNGNGRLDPGETLDLTATVRNFGVLADASGVALTLSSDDPYVSLGDASATVGAIAAGATGDNSGDPFVVSALASTPEGHQADFTLTVDEAGGNSVQQTISLTIGQATILYSQDFEVDATGWEQDPSHTASTGDFVRIDPNATTYQPGDDATPSPGVFGWITAQNSSLGNEDVDNGIAATRSPVFDLSGEGSAKLNLMYFHGQRDAGGDASDFFRIDVSNDGGATYPANLVSWGDATSSPNWTLLSVALDDFLPLTSQMRLRVQASDGGSSGDIIEAGLDDVVLLSNGSGNEAPSAPTLAAPADGATGQIPSLMLSVNNAVDPESDPLTYTFRVYSDELLTQEVASVTGVTEGAGTTEWTVSPALSAGTYYWRAHAADAEQFGNYMSAGSFTVDAVTGVEVAANTVGATLSRPSPNPFRAGTDVAFSISKQSRVRIDVFDLSGRHVKRLFQGVLEAGPHSRTWDGRDSGDAPVSAGVYFVQMHVDGVRQTQKMVRLR